MFLKPSYHLGVWQMPGGGGGGWGVSDSPSPPSALGRVHRSVTTSDSPRDIRESVGGGQVVSEEIRLPGSESGKPSLTSSLVLKV